MGQVEEVMKKDVFVVESLTSLTQTAKMMDMHGIGCLVVVDGKRVVGIVTDTDMRKCISGERDPKDMKVDDVMTRDVISIEKDRSLEDAVKTMKEHGIKKLPVKDGDRLVGIITSTDIVIFAPSMVESISKVISLQQPA